MKTSHWQFSLRSLFIVVTLIAGLTALVSNYPSVAFLSVLFALPLFFGELLSLLVASVPVVARSVMVLCATAFLVMVVVLGVKAHRDRELGEWSVWIAIAALCYFGTLCFFAAWSIPNKETSKRLAAQRIYSDKRQ